MLKTRHLNLTIKSCDACPYFRYESYCGGWVHWYCYNTGGSVRQHMTEPEHRPIYHLEIPDWCPLENNNDE